MHRHAVYEGMAGTHSRRPGVRPARVHDVVFPRGYAFVLRLGMRARVCQRRGVPETAWSWCRVGRTGVCVLGGLAWILLVSVCFRTCHTVYC